MVKNLPLSLGQVQKLGKIPCDACHKAKGKRLPFPKESKTEIRAPLQRLHLDIMGPVHIRGLRGEFYILCLIDQFSGFAEVLCLRTRDEAPLAVQTIILRWSNQLQGFAFKCLRSDRAKEFIVKWFEDWLISVGAVHELSLVYTAQQNATVERYNGVLQSIARSIHLESKLAKSFWPYAFLAACYLRNRLPNQGRKTPYELFYGVMPDVSLLRVFGCPCYVTLVNGKKRNKLDERALSGRLVGYSLVSKGYFIWVPKLRQVVESRDVLFYEQFSYNCIPGLPPYDGSPYVSSIPAAINGHMPEAAVHSLDPLLSPIVDHCPGHRMILRPRSGAAGTVLRENALGGRGSAVPTDKILAESQGVARPSSASNSVGEALGLRQSQIIVEPLIGPLSNSHPAPIILDGSKGLVSASPPAVPDRLIGSPGDDVAFADSASDDLDHWSGSDTAYGWGVPVDPGFVELEANKAGPVQPGSSSALGALLPVTADTADIPAAHGSMASCYEG
eukprot:gene6560-biopygen1754